MGQVATGTIMPTTSVPNEMRSTDVVTDSMMNGDCIRALAIAGVGCDDPGTRVQLFPGAGVGG
jgi:hypothetical protein